MEEPAVIPMDKLDEIWRVSNKSYRFCVRVKPDINCASHYWKSHVTSSHMAKSVLYWTVAKCNVLCFRGHMYSIQMAHPLPSLFVTCSSRDLGSASPNARVNPAAASRNVNPLTRCYLLQLHCEVSRTVLKQFAIKLEDHRSLNFIVSPGNSHDTD